MKRLFGLLAVLSCLLALPAAASAQGLTFTAQQSNNLAPQCPGGYVASMQAGDATPPAAPAQTCGLYTMSQGVYTTLTGTFAQPSDYGTVVASVYYQSGDHPTSLALLLDGQQVGNPITAVAETTQWYSFPAVDVTPSDTVAIKLTIHSGGTVRAWVESMHAEFTANTLAALITSDMTSPDEQLPEGVPCSYDWSGCDGTHQGAVIHDYSPTVAAPGFSAHGYHYIDPWGQVYDAKTGNPAPADRAEVRDLQEWWLAADTDTWHPAWSAVTLQIGGGLYPESFVGNAICAGLDYSDDPMSVMSSPNLDCHGTAESGYLFHFFPTIGRSYSPNPANIKAVASMAQMRLASTNPAGDSPDLVGNMGADVWACQSGCSSVDGMGESRFKTLTSQWKTFVFSTAGATDPLPPFVVNGQPIPTSELYTH